MKSPNIFSKIYIIRQKYKMKTTKHKLTSLETTYFQKAK